MSRSAKLPVTSQIASTLPKDLFDGLILIAIQHLLRDTLTFLLELKKLGFRKIIVLGKSYSSRDEVIQELNKNGIFASVHSNDELDDSNFICKEVSKIYEECIQNKTKFLILEDGGYIVPSLHKACPKLLNFCLGAVEQTKTGHWRDEELEKSVSLKIPVISVAYSALKQIIESPEVGNAIARNLEVLLVKMGSSLSQRYVSVLGYGWIGQNTAIALKNRHAKVSVYDKSYVTTVKAHYDARRYGFQIVDRATGLTSAEIIIGATGDPKASLKAEDFAILRDGVILVNATSKQIEFDIPYLESCCTNRIVHASLGTEYIMRNGKKIVVLADGFPINFFVGESVPESIIDIIIAEMLVCLRKLVMGNLQNKIYTITLGEEDKIAEEWLQKH